MSRPSRRPSTGCGDATRNYFAPRSPRRSARRRRSTASYATSSPPSVAKNPAQAGNLREDLRNQVKALRDADWAEGEAHMVVHELCPRCKEAVPADAPEGLCPECLLRQSFDTPSERLAADQDTGPFERGFAPPAAADLARHFPQLEILELVGVGGMGAVYRARQPSL